MSRLTELRERVIQRLETFKESREPRHEITWGLLGDAAETVAVPDQAAKVNVRLLGNDTNVVRAWNSQVPLVYDLRVDVEVERQEGMPNDYTVLGVAKIGYGGYVDKGRFFVPPHHETHEYASSVGGYDIVNVYNRALAELRADAWTTPDMTLRISAGLYTTLEGLVIRGTATSPTFSAAPAVGYQRFDLLYLNTDNNQYEVSEGDEALAGHASRPLPEVGQIAIAWVFFQAGLTAITNSMLIDARSYLLPVGAFGVIPHPLDPRDVEGVHTGSLEGLHVHATDEDKSLECDGSKTDFITAQMFTPGSLQVFLNGQLLTQDDDYTTGALYDSFTMSTAPVAGDAFLISYVAWTV